MGTRSAEGSVSAKSTERSVSTSYALSHAPSTSTAPCDASPLCIVNCCATRTVALPTRPCASALQSSAKRSMSRRGRQEQKQEPNTVVFVEQGRGFLFSHSSSSEMTDVESIICINFTAATILHTSSIKGGHAAVCSAHAAGLTHHAYPAYCLCHSPCTCHTLRESLAVYPAHWL